MAQLFECAFVFIASDSSAEAQELQVLVAPLANHGATNARLLHCRLSFPCKPEVGLNFISFKFSFCGLHWLMTHNDLTSFGPILQNICIALDNK
jgi:hypothetical protein